MNHRRLPEALPARRGRRRIRTELVAMRPDATRSLAYAYEQAGFGPAELAELDDLWDYAHTLCTDRGRQFERPEGPVGTSWINSILDIPESQWDRYYKGQE